MSTEIRIDISSAQDIIKKHGLGPGGSVQKFFTNELLRISSPYTPFDSGILSGTAYIPADATSLNFITPYARYLWHGKLMVDPVTKKGAFFSPEYGYWSRPNTQKELTNKDLKYQGAPLRGPRWTERAYLDNKENVLNSVEKFVNRR